VKRKTREARLVILLAAGVRHKSQQAARHQEALVKADPAKNGRSNRGVGE
jgi:hypothetical protein